MDVIKSALPTDSYAQASRQADVMRKGFERDSEFAKVEFGRRWVTKKTRYWIPFKFVSEFRQFLKLLILPISSGWFGCLDFQIQTVLQLNKDSLITTVKMVSIPKTSRNRHLLWLYWIGKPTDWEFKLVWGWVVLITCVYCLLYARPFIVILLYSNVLSNLCQKTKEIVSFKILHDVFNVIKALKTFNFRSIQNR